jgi:hypothetical protein
MAAGAECGLDAARSRAVVQIAPLLADDGIQCQADPLDAPTGAAKVTHPPRLLRWLLCVPVVILIGLVTIRAVCVRNR